MTDLALETPEGVVLRFEIAGVGTRILSAAIDGLIFGLAIFVTVLFLSVFGLGLDVLVATGTVLLLVAYNFVFSVLWDGRTPGKLWTGTRVCDEQGFSPRVTQHFLRALFVPFEALLFLPFPLVWLLIAITPRHQRLGDLVAGTVVLHVRRRSPTLEPAVNLRWSTLDQRDYPLVPSLARRFDGRDLGFLRGLLTRFGLEPDAKERLHLRAARHFAARAELAPRGFGQDEARSFLRELFLFLREQRGERLSTTTRPAEDAGARGTPPASAPPPR